MKNGSSFWNDWSLGMESLGCYYVKRCTSHFCYLRSDDVLNFTTSTDDIKPPCGWRTSTSHGQVGREFDWLECPDGDGDGYGWPGFFVESCTAPPNMVLNSEDCDDNN